MVRRLPPESTGGRDYLCIFILSFGLLITLHASEAAAQCIVIGPVCGFVCL